MIDDYDDEADELLRQRNHDKRYRAALARAPDCDDPAHPGCQACSDEDDDE